MRTETFSILLSIATFFCHYDNSLAFVVNPKTITHRLSCGGIDRSSSSSPYYLYASPDNNDNEITTDPVEEQQQYGEKDEDSEEKSILSKINDVLDTPILDANNKEDQGPIVEALKKFVRDEPELSSVTFSVVVVTLMAVATRGTMYLVNGY